MDLNAAVADVLDSTDLVTPEEIAHKVVGDIPDEDLRAVLTLVLPGYVRGVIYRRRAHNPYLTGSPPPARSAKVAAIRDTWSQPALRDRVHVGDGEWKLLGHCTYRDLMCAAMERRRLAQANLAKADHFEALANLLTARDVTHVADLPADDLDQWGDDE
jgi:hypothetical protein